MALPDAVPVKVAVYVPLLLSVVLEIVPLLLPPVLENTMVRPPLVNGLLAASLEVSVRVEVLPD